MSPQDPSTDHSNTHAAPQDARFLPAVCMPQPVPPRLARKLRRQGYTPRPAYVKAKAALGGMV